MSWDINIGEISQVHMNLIRYMCTKTHFKIFYHILLEAIELMHASLRNQWIICLYSVGITVGTLNNSYKYIGSVPMWNIPAACNIILSAL